jgi:hypothetical protein
VKRSTLYRLAFAGAAGVTMLAGCTLLISFDDAAPTDEAGADAPLKIDGPGERDVDVGLPDADASAEAADAGPDARDAIANPTACDGKVNGRYCGGNQITWPPELKDDLITCNDGGIASVRYCAQGVGCIAMANGLADECDECAGKADGQYCGRDMPGWSTSNMNQRVRCENGREVGLLLCITCKSNGAASACQ